MYYFCTYFDSYYLPKALCLLDSLNLHCPSFTLYMLCLDEASERKIKEANYGNVKVVSLKELETAYPQLSELKNSRSKIEYYYTCGPAYIRYVLDMDKSIDLITYLDADMYFYDDPTPLYQALTGHSIGVIGTHLPEFRKSRVWQGTYNVGWLNFRRDAEGIKCLEWWRDRCLEWCYERYEDGKYADQLYLDKWPELFEGFYEFTHRGANAGPWNIGDYKISKRDDKIFLDNYPLLFYHFHGLKKISPSIYYTSLFKTLKPMPPILKQMYIDYIKQLKTHSPEQDPTASIRKYRAKYHLLKTAYKIIVGIIFGQYIIIK